MFALFNFPIRTVVWFVMRLEFSRRRRQRDLGSPLVVVLAHWVGERRIPEVPHDVMVCACARATATNGSRICFDTLLVLTALARVAAAKLSVPRWSRRAGGGEGA